MLQLPVLALAVTIDRVFGEPPTELHPVVWLGRLIGWLEARAPAQGAGRLMLFGGGLVVTVLGAAALPALLLDRLTRRWPVSISVLTLAIALKPAFAWRSLDDHVRRVAAPLQADDVPGARRALSMIVSRPTQDLDAARVAAGAIESLAENLSDSLVAPVFWFAVAGLPGAWVYRAANTMDAMIGYRTARHEYTGKVAAHLDDAFNWLPARVTSLLIIAASAIVGASSKGAWRITRRDGSATASPNAGRPMAAMAGALGVELEKTGHYHLGAGQRAPVTADVYRALAITRWAALLGIALVVSVRAAFRRAPR